MNTMHTNIKETAELLPTLMNAGIVPFLHSSPALGKSSIAKQIADKFKLKVIDLRLTELDPTDLNGLPKQSEEKAMYQPFNTFPIQGDKVPNGYKGWLLLLDEFNSASEAVQAAAYKLVLDRQVGQYKLHDKLAIIACGNLESDNAIVNTMSSALISRFAHFTVKPDLKVWNEWAMQNNIHSSIISFLGFRPSAFYTFDSDNIAPYACPRTWEMVSKVLPTNITDLTYNQIPMLSGLIGQGNANEFFAFTKVYKDLPTYEELVKDPSILDVETLSLSTSWALASMLADRVEEPDIQQVMQIVMQLNPEVLVCFLRTLIARKPLLSTHAEVNKAKLMLSDFLSA